MRQCRQSPTANRRSLVWFFIIAGFAFVLRLIHLLQLRHNDPLFFSPQMDAQYHHEWALAIVAGKQFIADAFFRAPLYPYFLGFIYKLTGANQMVARVVQALIGSAGCGLVYLLARQLLGKHQFPGTKPQSSPKTANSRADVHSSFFTIHSSDAVPRIAGFVMAAYPLAIWYDGELLLEGIKGVDGEIGGDDRQRGAKRDLGFEKVTDLAMTVVIFDAGRLE